MHQSLCVSHFIDLSFVFTCTLFILAVLRCKNEISAYAWVIVLKQAAVIFVLLPWGFSLYLWRASSTWQSIS